MRRNQSLPRFLCFAVIAVVAFLLNACSDVSPSVGFLRNQPNIGIPNGKSQAQASLGSTDGTVVAAGNLTYSTHVTISKEEKNLHTTDTGSYSVSPIEVSYE
ncbi:MAG: hypothetical protein ACLGGX_05760 [Bdellovibrionia bacterium]